MCHHVQAFYRPWILLASIALAYTYDSLKLLNTSHLSAVDSNNSYVTRLPGQQAVSNRTLSTYSHGVRSTPLTAFYNRSEDLVQIRSVPRLLCPFVQQFLDRKIELDQSETTLSIRVPGIGTEKFEANLTPVGGVNETEQIEELRLKFVSIHEVRFDETNFRSLISGKNETVILLPIVLAAAMRNYTKSTCVRSFDARLPLLELRVKRLALSGNLSLSYGRLIELLSALGSGKSASLRFSPSNAANINNLSGIPLPNLSFDTSVVFEEVDIRSATLYFEHAGSSIRSFDADAVTMGNVTFDAIRSFRMTNCRLIPIPIANGHLVPKTADRLNTNAIEKHLPGKYATNASQRFGAVPFFYSAYDAARHISINFPGLSTLAISGTNFTNPPVITGNYQTADPVFPQTKEDVVVGAKVPLDYGNLLNFKFTHNSVAYRDFVELLNYTNAPRLRKLDLSGTTFTETDDQFKGHHLTAVVRERRDSLTSLRLRNVTIDGAGTTDESKFLKLLLHPMLEMSPLLTRLDISNNELDQSAENSLNFNHTLLESLNLSNNHLTRLAGPHLPATLKALDLSGNHFKSLPDFLDPILASSYENESPRWYYPRLRYVNLSNNLFRHVPQKLFQIGNLVSRLKLSRTNDERNLTAVSSDVQLLNGVSRFKNTNDTGTPEFESYSIRIFWHGNPVACDCHLIWLKRLFKQPNGISRSTKFILADLNTVTCYDAYSETNVPLVDFVEFETRDTSFSTKNERRVLHRSRLSDNTDTDLFERPKHAVMPRLLCTYKTRCAALCKCCPFKYCDCKMTCPDDCTCYRDSSWTFNAVKCTESGLTTIPPNLPRYSTVLHLDGNDLEEIGTGAFFALIDLVELYLNASNVKALNPMSFASLSRLAYLDLSRNHIDNLPKGVFDQVTLLEYLNLAHNALEYLDSDTFLPFFSPNSATDSVTLSYVDLSYNLIDTIDPLLWSTLSRIPIEQQHQQNRQQHLRVNKKTAVLDLSGSNRVRCNDCQSWTNLALYSAFFVNLDGMMCLDSRTESTRDPDGVSESISFEWHWLNRTCPGYEAIFKNDHARYLDFVGRIAVLATNLPENEAIGPSPLPEYTSPTITDLAVKPASHDLNVSPPTKADEVFNARDANEILIQIEPTNSEIRPETFELEDEENDVIVTATRVLTEGGGVSFSADPQNVGVAENETADFGNTDNAGRDRSQTTAITEFKSQIILISGIICFTLLLLVVVVTYKILLMKKRYPPPDSSCAIGSCPYSYNFRGIGTSHSPKECITHHPTNKPNLNNIKRFNSTNAKSDPRIMYSKVLCCDKEARINEGNSFGSNSYVPAALPCHCSSNATEGYNVRRDFKRADGMFTSIRKAAPPLSRDFGPYMPSTVSRKTSVTSLSSNEFHKKYARQLKRYDKALFSNVYGDEAWKSSWPDTKISKVNLPEKGYLYGQSISKFKILNSSFWNFISHRTCNAKNTSNQFNKEKSTSSERKPYDYDCFVSYTQSEHAYVNHVLGPGLEKFSNTLGRQSYGTAGSSPVKYKVCLEYRREMYLTDLIKRCAQRSRKIIFVVDIRAWIGLNKTCTRQKFDAGPFEATGSTKVPNDDYRSTSAAVPEFDASIDELLQTYERLYLRPEPLYASIRGDIDDLADAAGKLEDSKRSLTHEFTYLGPSNDGVIVIVCQPDLLPSQKAGVLMNATYDDDDAHSFEQLVGRNRTRCTGKGDATGKCFSEDCPIKSQFHHKSINSPNHGRLIKTGSGDMNLFVKRTPSLKYVESCNEKRSNLRISPRHEGVRSRVFSLVKRFLGHPHLLSTDDLFWEKLALLLGPPAISYGEVVNDPSVKSNAEKIKRTYRAKRQPTTEL